MVEKMSSSISVCIPTFNQALFIEKGIESLLSQTIPPYEIIVSNNHSTDATAELLAKYGDKIKVVKPPKHCPMTQNFIFSAGQATGGWLCFLGSDDFVRPNYIELLEAGIRTSKETDVVIFGGSEAVDEHGTVKQRLAMLSFPRRVGGRDAFKLFVGGTKLLLDSLIIRRSAFLKVGGFDERTLWAFDWDLYIRLSEIGTFYNTRRYLSYKRFWDRPEDGSRLVIAQLADYLRIYKVYIVPKLADLPAIFTDKAVETLRLKFVQTMRAAIASGTPLEELERLGFVAEYRRLLGIENSVEAYISGRDGHVPGSLSPVSASHRPFYIRWARGFAAPLLGWR